MTDEEQNTLETIKRHAATGYILGWSAATFLFNLIDRLIDENVAYKELEKARWEKAVKAFGPGVKKTPC